MADNFSREDVAKLFNLVQEQLREDRDSVNDLYDELREHVREHPARFIDMGEVLAKLSDIKLKQTAQVLDTFKAVDKIAPKEDFGGLDEGDLELINEALNPDDE